MGAYVFDNQIFDSWLTKKSDEILSKVDRETISNEDMLILILKALTNHFHHVDVEFREEFKKIDLRFKNEKDSIKQSFEKIHQRFDDEAKQIDERFEKIHQRFDDQARQINERFEVESAKIDARFEKMWSFQKWQAGIMLSLFSGLYLKLFLS